MRKYNIQLIKKKGVSDFPTTMRDPELTTTELQRLPNVLESGPLY